VTLGKLSTQQQGEPLTPFTVVIGKKGVGKSTLFDAFGFVADCLSTDVETACDAKQRGGFERMRSLGTVAPIQFEIYFREAPRRAADQLRTGDQPRRERPTVCGVGAPEAASQGAEARAPLSLPAAAPWAWEGVGGRGGR